MSLILWALLNTAVAVEAPCPSVWPYDGLMDVPTDGRLLDLCPTSSGRLQLSVAGETVATPTDPWLPDTEYQLFREGAPDPLATFRTGSEVTQPVESAPEIRGIQTNTLGGGLSPASLDWLVRHDAPADNAAAVCVYEATHHSRLACRAADGNRALAFNIDLGSFPPSELCIELAWHDARGGEGPSSDPVCTEIIQPAAPIEEGCSTAAGPGTWLWCGLLVLVRRRRPGAHSG